MRTAKTMTSPEANSCQYDEIASMFMAFRIKLIS